MGKVYINYLKKGCIAADAPDNFVSMTDEEKMKWAFEVLENSSDRELINGLADYNNPKKYGFFDETPEPLAIEEDDTETYITTNVWESYFQPVEIQKNGGLPMVAENIVADNIINELSAHMTGLSVEEYDALQNKMLNKLDVIEHTVKKAKVVNLDDYKKYLGLKQHLSSLYCYTFNTRNEVFDRVSAIEGEMGAKLYSFAKNYGKASPAIRPVIKYALSNSYYSRENVEKMVRELQNAGHLWKIDEDGNNVSHYVTGLHLAVGDNVFNINRRTGRQYRQYVKTCALQAFRLPYRWSTTIRALEKEGMEVPELNENLLCITGLANMKGCAKISLSQAYRAHIINNYIK